MKAESRHKRAETHTLLCDYTPQMHVIEFFCCLETAWVQVMVHVIGVLLLGNSFGPCALPVRC